MEFGVEEMQEERRKLTLSRIEVSKEVISKRQAINCVRRMGDIIQAGL